MRRIILALSLALTALMVSGTATAQNLTTYVGDDGTAHRVTHADPLPTAGPTGPAGTPSSSVTTVQGVAGGTPVVISDGSGLANSLTVDCAGAACATAAKQDVMITAIGTPMQQSGGSVATSHTSYTLLNAATSTGAQSIAPDTYTLTFPTAFNGATISVAVTDPSGNVVTTAYTSAPTTPVAGYYGATSVTATASGGTPTGSLKLNGGPPASSSGGGGGGGGAVTVADGADVTQGALADAAYSGSGSSTVVAALKGNYAAVAAMSAKLPSSLGAKTGALSFSIVPNTDTPFPVTPAATENFLGKVGGVPILTSATFTTTSLTTAWSPNWLIADNATAGSVTVMSFASACRTSAGSGYLFRARIKVASDTGFAGQSVILKLYKTSPTLTNGDRALWLTTESNYLGQMSVTLDQHFSDFEKGIGSPSVGNFIRFDCTVTTIYGLLVSSGTITPQAGSKAITAFLEGTTD